MCICISAWGLSYFSCVWLFSTQKTVACQSPLSIGSSSKNTEVEYHALLQGIFSTQESNLHLLRLLHFRRILSHWAMEEVCVCIYPLFFEFPSHLGHHRALSRVPCAVQQVLISYLFCTLWHIYVNPNLPIHPTSLLTYPPDIHPFVLYIGRDPK